MSGGVTYVLTIEVDSLPGQAVGIKEQLAMDMEQRYGSVRVVSVREKPGPQVEQMRFY